VITNSAIKYKLIR